MLKSQAQRIENFISKIINFNKLKVTIMFYELNYCGKFAVGAGAGGATMLTCPCFFAYLF